MYVGTAEGGYSGNRICLIDNITLFLYQHRIDIDWEKLFYILCNF